MISFLRGRVASVSGQAAVIDVGGVGISALCTPATLGRLRVGENATIATSLVVREESLTLYGFAEDDEREAFEVLQTASGIGPRIALAILAVLTPEALRRAVAAEDTAALTRVPGVGKKGAQRMVLELRDKLGPPAGAADADGAGAPAFAAVLPGRVQAVEGLVNLGWSPRDADAAVEKVMAELDAAEAERMDTAALLRSALRKLSRA